ncbi:uncharacterized protein LOC129183308 isoform X3 [Dunckerocampus dactyliophorus]|uniref:uncharacterized protein LOC129183308 isoform X3 n=1 Tax=Dunckerocampus dactyliophorus TaxID=161453 RepID=UPI002406346F|nr:uncharacterized protein LOC129183308 isoform X3 [Dunckerocampus dactyliophorus]
MDLAPTSCSPSYANDCRSADFTSPGLDIQQLTGRQGDHPPQPQGGSSTWEQEEPQPPLIKEEEMQPEHPHIKEEEEEPQPPDVKEEEEELSITQEGEHLQRPEEADLARLPLTGVPAVTKDHEDKPPELSQLHHSPSEEMREAEPCSSSLQHMTTEADGDHCGGSQADNLFAPLSDSDDTTSHSPEGEDSDYNQESLSSDTDCEGDMMMTGTGNKHSKSSKKTTGLIKDPHNKTAECTNLDNVPTTWGYADNESTYVPVYRHDDVTPSEDVGRATRFTANIITLFQTLLNKCLNQVAWEIARSECNGCIIEHPSQLQHSCLHERGSVFYINHYSRVVDSVFRPSLTTALQQLSCVEPGCLVRSTERLLGAAEAIIHHLMEKACFGRIQDDDEEQGNEASRRKISMAFLTWLH